MSKIYVSTRAYNAEKTIGRAIESILNQTHTNWVYYICNNGSTDATGDIIEAYAKKDSRIKTFHNKENWVFNDETKQFNSFMHHLSAHEYWCLLDADDAYINSFMEKSLSYLEKNALDLVVTNHQKIDTTTGHTKIHGLPDHLIITLDHFTTTTWIYVATHMWAILYTAHALKNYEYSPINLSSATDTYFIWEVIKNCNRIGFLAEPLYQYYRYGKDEQTTMHRQKFNPNRIKANDILIEKLDTILQRNTSNVIDIEFVCYKSYSIFLTGILHSLSLATDNPAKKLDYATQLLFDKRLEPAIIILKNGIITEHVLNHFSQILHQASKVMKGKSMDKAMRRLHQLQQLQKR